MESFVESGYFPISWGSVKVSEEKEDRRRRSYNFLGKMPSRREVGKGEGSLKVTATALSCRRYCPGKRRKGNLVSKAVFPPFLGDTGNSSAKVCIKWKHFWKHLFLFPGEVAGQGYTKKQATVVSGFFGAFFFLRRTQGCFLPLFWGVWRQRQNNKSKQLWMVESRSLHFVVAYGVSLQQSTCIHVTTSGTAAQSSATAASRCPPPQSVSHMKRRVRCVWRNVVCTCM